jgi:chromate reductase, NAD(P)H dehydrogenase (quinone)
MKIIGICGSLRKASFNRMTLKIAQMVMPDGVEFEIVEIGDLPHFNQDIEEMPPEPVIDFREKVKSANAILFAVAEYNYSVSSVLKNAIEWASRPYGQGVLNNKAVAMMGASSGMLGTGRAQYHLRQMLVQTNSYTLNKPEVMITFAQDKFSSDGRLLDDKTREKIQELVLALVEKCRQDRVMEMK